MMSADLAPRLQRLIDGGAPPISVDEVMHGQEGRRTPGPRYGLRAAAVVLLLVAVIAGVAVLSHGGSGRTTSAASVSVPLAQVPDGVTVQQFGDRLAFVVRDGARVTVFDTNVHHLPGERALWWCPNERLFVSPTHAEVFTPSGKAIGGPATAGLDRLDAEVRHGTLIVDPTKITPGARGNAHTGVGNVPDRGFGSWDSGSGSFCAGAFRAANSSTPTATLNIKALASISYDQKLYEVPSGLIEIRFMGAAGLLFTFDDPRYRYCLLTTDPGPKAAHSCRVSLGPGQYLVYDSVLGHQRAGLQATIQADPLPAPTQGQPATSTSPSR